MVGLLAGDDFQVEAVFRRRQRTGRERRECTRRVVTLVEVQNDIARRIGLRNVEEATRRIAAMAAGAVGEDQRQTTAAFVQRLDPDGLVAALEFDRPGIRY